jgi:hypothetical protein
MSALYHAYSQTVADGTATSVVRPSDWNSAHVQGQTISGNTAGFSSFTGTNIVLQGGNNVTLSAATAAGAATIIISGANTVAQTVQTQASGAIAGTGFTSTTTAGTAITAAMGTNGLSMAVPQFITTYVNDLTSGRAGTGFTSTTTAGTAITAALGTNGLSMAIPAFLTTATQSVQTQASGAIAGTGFTSTTTAGTAITAALGTNGLTMAVPQYITTFVNDLTSGRAGTGFTSTTTAGTAIVATQGTNGLSMAVPAYITTFAAQTADTNKAGTGTTLATTNINATLAANTNGVALSLSVPDVDFNAWNLLGNTSGTTGTTVTTQGALYFHGGNNITLSGNSNTIVISAGAGGGTTNQTGPNIAVVGSTITSGTVVFSNSNGVSFGLNGSTLTASVLPNPVRDGWAPYSDLEVVAGQQGQGTLYFEPEHSPNFIQDRVGIPIAYTNATNSTGSVTLSYWIGLYTQNVSTLSLASSTSFSTGFTFSGTVASYSLFSGMRLLTIPWSLTLADQEVYIGQLSRTTTGGANASISQMLVTNINSNFVGFFGLSHNTTMQFTQGQGVYSTTTAALPNSVAFSQIRGSDSLAFRAPAIRFINSTV